MERGSSENDVAAVKITALWAPGSTGGGVDLANTSQGSEQTSTSKRQITTGATFQDGGYTRTTEGLTHDMFEPIMS